MPDPRTSAAVNPHEVTVVVPTRNAARTLAACLESLRAQTAPCRTVVMDNGSTDGTTAIAEEWADVVLHAGPERSAQRNYGARAFPAAIVGFIDADMVLDPDVVAQAHAAIIGGAGAVIVPEETVGDGFWAGVRAFERSFYAGADNIEAARFYRRDVFERTGGFAESLTGPEDIGLTMEARRAAPVARVSAVIHHDEGRVEFLDACRKKGYYAPGMRRYIAKRGVGAVRTFANRPWLRHPAKLLSTQGAGLLALKVGEAVGEAVALGNALVTQLAGHAGPGRAADGQLAQIGLAGAGPIALSPTTQSHWSAPLVHRGRRLCRSVVWRVKVCQTMRHGGSTLARLAVGFLSPNLAGDVTFAGKDGTRLVAPAKAWDWWPIVVVVVDDCYRLQELASDLRGTACRVFDIGAHVGSFTVALASAVPETEVTAFEASAGRVSYLRRNIAGNGLADRVTVVQAAVGGQAGRAILIGSEMVPRSAEADGELVNVVGFEDVMNSIDGAVDLVKMDCEGGEYDIVASASKSTLRRIDRLVLGYHPAPPAQVTQLFATLAEAGLVECWRHNVLPGQLDVVSLGRSVG